MPPTPSTTADAATTTPPSPPSPTASFYDMSDDEEGEYSTIRHTKSSKGVKLLFARSKVFAHPTPSAKDNVAGYLALLQQKPAGASQQPPTGGSSEQPGNSTAHSRRATSDYLLAWVPENSLGEDARATYLKVDLATRAAASYAASPPRESSLVPRPPVVSTNNARPGAHAFAIGLSDIFSVLVRPPNAGWWFGSLVINARVGDSFPALFFHDSEPQATPASTGKQQQQRDSVETLWAGDQVLAWLRRYVAVERSAQEPNIYLIEPSEADKIAFGGGSESRPTPDKIRNVLEGKHKDDPAAAKPKKDGGDPVVAALKQARWSFLETMAQVTTFTRRTAQAVADNKNLPPPVRRLLQSPQVQTVSDEFDSARLYLARWAMGIAEQSEKERNHRIWTAKDILAMEESEVGQFEILDLEARNLGLADQRQPVTLQEWQRFFNSRTGRLEKTPDEVKERIFRGGLSSTDGVRKEAWLFLLGVYDWESTEDERRAKMNSLRDEYVRLKAQWWERMVDEAGTLEEREWWKEQKMRIEKDVHRTDRHLPLFAGEDIPHPDPDSPFAETGTNVHLEQMKDMLLTYNEQNRDLGYVQGMSDLLAPIYAVQQDDAVAFWGFVKFMERMERNFLRDQSGMRLQLMTLDQMIQLLDPQLYEHLARLDSTNFFFFFRMLLVWFKREFEFEAILRLWEALWTDRWSANFHLFIAAAILEKHRDVIIEHLKGFDEVLKYINELSGRIDLPSTMLRAEALFRRFQRVVDAVDKKSNFPAPTVRQRIPQPPLPSPSSPSSTLSRPGSDGRPRRPSASSSGHANAASPEISPSARRAAQIVGGVSQITARVRRPSEQATPASPEPERERVITPELRALLSREIPKLDKAEVREHGGGVGS